MGIIFILILLAFISGCIAEEKNTEEVVMKEISISSPAFQSGGFIPAKYTCDGSDVSPPLAWKGVPSGTKSIALVMEDPDAPGKTFVHWVLFNIPPDRESLPEGISGSTLSDGSRHGITDFGDIGYGGPCPPPGKPHRYYFRLYALDTKLELAAGAARSDLERAMKGHIIAKGELMGKYGR